MTQSVPSLDTSLSQSQRPWGVLIGMRQPLGTIEMFSSYRVGRSETNDIVVEGATVSGTHCTIDEPGLVSDHSTNGTFINGKKIGKGQQQMLKHGDELTLGIYSAEVARKHAKFKDIFVSYIFRREGGAEEPEIEVHPAFAECGELGKKYRCDKTLGSGAFAEVRLCYKRDTGQKYAIKLVDKKRFALNRELRKGSYIDEVSILKTLDHPYIVQVVDMFESKNYLSIILEYVGGGDLFDAVVDVTRYPESASQVVFLQMVEGLKYLHDKGIAHRDLKPENFLVLETPKPKIHVRMGDFGLARVFGEETMMKTLCGTPQYLAPEVLQQARDGRRSGYDSAVDVWALGCVLYILLAGYPPFRTNEDIIEIKYNFSHSRWQNVSSLAKDLIRKILVKNPNERLTVDQCLAHPWLQGVVVPAIDAGMMVEPTLSQMERIQAVKRKGDEDEADKADEPSSKKQAKSK